MEKEHKNEKMVCFNIIIYMYTVCMFGGWKLSIFRWHEYQHTRAYLGKEMDVTDDAVNASNLKEYDPYNPDYWYKA